MLDDLAHTEYGKAGRQWIYQTCTEFGWYQTSDQPKHPYGSRFPLKDSIKVYSCAYSASFSNILMKIKNILQPLLFIKCSPDMYRSFWRNVQRKIY